MNRESQEFHRRMSRQIDRLVVGELAEEDRKELFQWCNRDPLRWRQCALTFLEAQTWQQGMTEWSSRPMSGETVCPAPVSAAPSTPRRFGWRALAATIVIAFACGFLARWPGNAPATSTETATIRQGTGPGEAGANPVAAIASSVAVQQDSLPYYVNVSVRTPLSPNQVATLQIPVSQTDAISDKQLQLSDYVKKQWEKHGYQVATSERFLTGHLPDGRNVAIPVSGLQVRYVGKPVY